MCERFFSHGYSWPHSYPKTVYSLVRNYVFIGPLFQLVILCSCLYVIACRCGCCVVVWRTFLHSLSPDTQLQLIVNMLVSGCMGCHACSGIR